MSVSVKISVKEHKKDIKYNSIYLKHEKERKKNGFKLELL